MHTEIHAGLECVHRCSLVSCKHQKLQNIIFRKLKICSKNKISETSSPSKAVMTHVQAD